MTDTTVTSRLLGSAWPQHMNKTIAETMYANIEKVGLPTWDAADVALAKGIQKELKQPQVGLATAIGPLRGGLDPEQNMGGPSDDIGDVSWNVPTVTLGYPANIPNLPGHNWANGIAMATPIAHKGVTAGAKVQAMTIIDMLMRPELVQGAWDYFKNVQTKDQKYIPFISDKDQPAIDLNKKIVDQYRAEMKKYYFDPTKYKTYLEQLGIKTARRGEAEGLSQEQLRRRDEVVEVTPDDFLDDDVRVFLRHDVGIEVVLPEIDRAAEVLGQERHQLRRERVAEDHGARQGWVVDLGDEVADFIGRRGAGRLDHAGAARVLRHECHVHFAQDPRQPHHAAQIEPFDRSIDVPELVARPCPRRLRQPRPHGGDDPLIRGKGAAVVPVRVGFLIHALPDLRLEHF